MGITMPENSGGLHANDPHELEPNGRVGAVQAHLLLMISCLPILGMLVIAPILPEMQRHFSHVAQVELLVPFALTAPALMLVLIAPFAHRIVTAVGRKRALLVALLIYLVAATAPLYLETLSSIIVSRLIVGAPEAILMTVATMLLGDYFAPQIRDRYLAYQVVYTSVSAVIFLLLGGVMGEFGWRMPFFAYLITLVLIPAVLTLLTEPSAPPQVQAGEISHLPWRELLPIFLVTFFAGGCMNLVAVELGYLIEAVGETSSTLKGVGAAVNSAGIAMGAICIGALTYRDRVSHLVISFALSAVGFALMGLLTNLTAVIVGGGLAGLGAGFYLGWLLAAVQKPLSYETRGRGVGLWMASYFFATVLAPIAAVAAGGWLGGLQPAMLVFAGIMGLLAIFAPILLSRPE